MADQQQQSARTWTLLGLGIALLGLPLVVEFFRHVVGPRTAQNTVARETIILALVAVLLWIVRRKEKLGWDSVGLGRSKLGSTALWVLIAMLAALPSQSGFRSRSSTCLACSSAARTRRVSVPCRSGSWHSSSCAPGWQKKSVLSRLRHRAPAVAYRESLDRHRGATRHLRDLSLSAGRGWSTHRAADGCGDDCVYICAHAISGSTSSPTSWSTSFPTSCCRHS